MQEGLTRRRLLRLVAGGAAALGLLSSAALAARSAPHAFRISVRNAGRRYAGDRRLFATVAPGVRDRDAAVVSFRLNRDARVVLEALRTGPRGAAVVDAAVERLAAGEREIRWTPAATTLTGTYLVRLTVESEDGKHRVYGGRRPSAPERSRAPVVRVLGVEAAFERRSYLPGEPMALRVFADVPRFTLTFLRVGHGPDPSLRSDEMTGLPMGDPVPVDWTGKRGGPVTIAVQTGLTWPSGLYAARLEADGGRVGFAPFVLRPTAPGSTSRVAVVLPTNSWQAYNFYDADGDGFGDTWYAGGNPPVVLDRPFRDRGVPPRFRRYDFPFLRWLEKTGRATDVLAEDDLETIPSGDALRQLYDLVVFPGHTEYVTEHEYDVVERFRDLGGRLIFLSANNFFWKVERRDGAIRRVRLWRELGRPEASLLGVQYRANDDGTRQGVYYVVAAERVPWLVAGTGLENGSVIGAAVGGYGIEIDGTTGDSPPGTIVVALVPSLFGPGLHAEMAYYETPAGARVFSAGTLDFGTSVLTQPTWQLLDNLWRHMLADVSPPSR